MILLRHNIIKIRFFLDFIKKKPSTSKKKIFINISFDLCLLEAPPKISLITAIKKVALFKKIPFFISKKKEKTKNGKYIFQDIFAFQTASKQNPFRNL